MQEHGPVTVLHVEDNEVSRLAAAAALRRAGFAVREAATGLEALSLLAEHPDLVLLDVNLPDLNGFDICRRIKADPETASTPVVMLSGYYSRAEDRAQGLEGGADGYLAKPVDPEELVAQLKAVLRRRQAEAEAREAARSSEAARGETAGLLQSVLDGATECGIVATDLDGRIVLWNEGARLNNGYAAEEVVGRADVRILFAPEDVASGKVQALFEEARRAGQAGGVLARVRKDGTRLTTSVALTLRRGAGGEPAGYVLVSRDVSRQQALEEELHRKDRALAAYSRRAGAEEARGRLLADLFREVRPLLGDVLRSPGGAEAAALPAGRECLGVIRSGARRLLRLINDFLDLAGGEAGDVDAPPGPVDVARVAREVLGLLRRPAVRKQVRVALRVEPGTGPVVAREALLRRVLFGCVADALAAAPEGGRVRVWVGPDGGGALRVEACAGGAGLRPRDVGRALAAARAADADGDAGFGLARARQLVEPRGGRAGVLLTAGRNRVFFAVLPPEAAPAPPSPGLVAVEAPAGERPWLTEALRRGRRADGGPAGEPAAAPPGPGAAVDAIALDGAGLGRDPAYLVEQGGALELRAAGVGPLPELPGRDEVLRLLERGGPLEVRLAGLLREGPAVKPGPGGRGVPTVPLPELARALARLRASERRYHGLVEGLQAVVWEAEPATRRFTFVSRRAEALLGYPLAHWLGGEDFWARLLHPEDRDATLARARQEAAAGRDHVLEYRAVAADGRVRWLQDSVSVARDEAGRPERLRGVTVDVTARRRAEESLRESTSLLRAVAEGTTDAVFVKDLQGRYLLMNPAGAALVGKSVAEVVGRQDWDIFDRDSARKVVEDDRRVLARGRPETYEDIVTAGGVTRTYLTTKAPYRNEAGEVLGLVGIARDVTEHLELRENQAKLRMAREIQRGFFPPGPPRLAGYDIAGASFPADATGGDLFDFIPLPDGSLAVAVGDASGHGFGPALLMAEARAYLRALALTRTDLSEVLGLLNGELAVEKTELYFVTLLLARVDPHARALSYASAGHPTGYVLGPDGGLKAALPSGGVPLGIERGHEFPAGPAVALAPGDLVLLVTDGAAEARSPGGGVFGTRRVLEAVRRHRARPARGIVEALHREVRAFAGGAPALDDVTAVVIKVEPGAGGVP
jgi:PAS domain S-box-containing protein